ncbi:glycosyl transferase [Saccharothrix sp. ALI-22-I]|uniref:glycosyltransferase family 2 protein n=1 Tax=Saccharothrix sp. ALI-22-I TaxID=1933778 RepID=UPI00097BB057|nr:glycosyltransferase [Saccharothrix sp. ALI-22-I]ONI90426.1 glycosyl transferase [Saccharothrix sp. ALI-22-I]
MSKPAIDPALGLDLAQERTLSRRSATVTVLVPAHNEAATVAEVIADASCGLDLLGVRGEVVVSASGCTDDTADVARAAGAKVVESPAGKGNAIAHGLRAATGDVICLIDGDLRYFGEQTLVELLVKPILDGLADVTVSDLYWRPIYPQLWLHGFFAPLAGRLFPEILPKVGATPWSGQRAAVRELWPEELPGGFTVDLALLLHWNRHATRMRPVLADDWTNPQRPKPELMRQEFELLVAHAVAENRPVDVPRLRAWFDRAHGLMAAYRPDVDDPRRFELDLLDDSLKALGQAQGGA